MKIDVIPFAKALEQEAIKGKTVVVIDVLRATSVMITALQNGAKEIIPCKTKEEAYRLAKELGKDTYLLCGERDAIKIEGFDLGNSPLEYTPEVVTDKTLILTTTNGTRALKACWGANDILIGAFLNVSSIVQKVKNLKELVLVCSGTRGKFSLDDGLCAARIMDELSKTVDVETDDLGQVLLNMLRTGGNNLRNKLNNCFHLKYLVEKGYEKDVEYCLQINMSSIIPIYKNNSVKLLRSDKHC